jgi:rRNA maturation endonuclease Nob1
VSRSTFQRVLAEARRKVALALVEGAALQIEGGTFRVADVHLHCSACGHDWRLVHGSGQGRRDTCPACGGTEIRERSGEAR